MPIEVKWGISFLAGGLILLLGWKVRLVLLTFHILVCFVLAIVVLLQSGSAADLAGAFGGAGSQTAFGPRGPANFLSKATTWCAVMFMLTSLVLVTRQDISLGGGSSVLQKFSKPAAPVKLPAPSPAKAPTQQPPTQQPQPQSQQPPAQRPQPH
jgi:preprotein translocase subunit SecG